MNEKQVQKLLSNHLQQIPEIPQLTQDELETAMLTFIGNNDANLN